MNIQAELENLGKKAYKQKAGLAKRVTKAHKMINRSLKPQPIWNPATLTLAGLAVVSLVYLTVLTKMVTKVSPEVSEENHDKDSDS